MSKQKDIGYYVHSLIGIAIMFGFGHIVPPEPITAIGMQALGIFLGLIYLWSFVGTLWPSLLGLVALGLSEYSNMSNVLTMSIGNDIVVQIIFIMALVGALEYWGITNHIAQWFITRKVNQGRPWIFSFMFILATYTLAALTNAMTTIVLAWSILYDILEKLNYKKGDKYSVIMVVGVIYASCLGLAALPFKSVPLIILGAFQKASGLQVDYLQYMVLVISISLICLTIYILIAAFVIKPDVTLLENADIEIFGKLEKLDNQQKIVSAVMVVCILAMLVPSILPKTVGLTILLNKMSATGIVIAGVIVLVLWKYEGTPLLNFKRIAGETIAWDLVFLAAAAMAVSSAMTAEETGIKAFLQQILLPIFSGKTPLMFLFTLIVLSMILTNIMNNAVVGLIFMPIVYSISMEIGGNSIAAAVLITLCLHVALLTPAASPSGALLHGNREWVPAKQAYLYSILLVLISFFVVVIYGIPVSNIIF